MAGLKDEGGRMGDWEDFSSLTPTRLDLCSYRQTHCTDLQRLHYQIYADKLVVYSHVSWFARVTAVQCNEIEASGENASSREKGSDGGNLDKQYKKYCSNYYYNSTTQCQFYLHVTCYLQFVLSVVVPES